MMNDLQPVFKPETVERFFMICSQVAKIYLTLDVVLESTLANAYPTYNVLSVSEKCVEQALAALARSDMRPAIITFFIAIITAAPVVFIDLTRMFFNFNHKFEAKEFVRFGQGRWLIFLVVALSLMSISLTLWGIRHVGHFLNVTSREQILAYAHSNA